MAEEEKALEIHVNLDGMLIGDLETLEKPANSSELIDALQRLVVDTDIRKLPIRAIVAIRDQVLAQLTEMQKAKY